MIIARHKTRLLWLLFSGADDSSADVPGEPYTARTVTELFSPKGGANMIGKDNLFNFRKMWTWLSGHPAHDREYYIEHVAKIDPLWRNCCPLANRESEDCDGCIAIWHSENGSLCTDPDAPIYKWQATSRRHPDYRTYYASKVAVLATNAIRGRGYDVTSPEIFGRDYIHSQLQA